MFGQLPALALLFGLIFGLNLIPAFAPPTWMALAFVGFEFPNTRPVLLALVGATATTLDFHRCIPSALADHRQAVRAGLGDIMARRCQLREEASVAG